MEQYPRTSVNLSQDDWASWLPLAGIALNNRDTEPTGVSPFFADRRRNMRSLSPDQRAPSPSSSDRAPAPVRLLREDVRAFANDMRKLHQKLNEGLTWIQNQRKEREATAAIESPAFRSGDMVWLSTRNLTNRLRPAKNLDNKRIGPFKIAEAIPSRSLQC